MDITDEDQQTTTEWAARHPKIREVWLYGSRAREDNRRDSDIDLAIVMQPQDGVDTFDRWSFRHSDYRENPDLHLSAEAHLEWYEEGANLERVGSGVEKDGILLFLRPEDVKG